MKRTASKRSTIADDMAQEGKQREKGAVEFDESHDNVDVVVVDADFDQLVARGGQLQDGSGGTGSETGGETMSHRESQGPKGTSTHDHPEGTEGSALHAITNSTPYIILRWRVWPFIWHFVDSSCACARFCCVTRADESLPVPDKDKEEAFTREQWYSVRSDPRLCCFG